MVKSILFFCTLCLLASCQNGPTIVYRIPKGFQGAVVIVFNQPNDQKVLLGNGNLTYNIPPSGILKVNAEPSQGWYHPRYFVVDSTGKSVPIKYYSSGDLEQSKPSAEELICFGSESGVTTDEETKEAIRFETLLVCKVKYLDSVAAQKSHIVNKALGRR